MSSILKALRKLEEERANRHEASLDIARDILRHPISRRRSATGRPLVLVLGVLILGATGWGFFEWRLPPAPPASVSPQAAQQPESPAPIAPSDVSPRPPAETVPASASSGRLAAVKAETRIIEERVSDPLPAAPARPAASRPAPPVRPASVVPQFPSSSTIETPAHRAASSPPAPVSAEAAEFLVSGIAYQEDPEARLAVVNDLPVMQGTAIDGATVVEILPDAVRFSREGTMFQVPISGR